MEGAAVIFIVLIWGGIFATVSGGLAHVKGRSVAGWAIGQFFLAFLFWPLAIILVIVLACLPNLRDQRAKEERQERENRRLREQLRQERMKAEAFRQHASARLDLHDANAGIDTRAANMALPGGEGAGQPPRMLEAHDPSALDGGASIIPAADAERHAAHAQQTRHVAGARHWHYEHAGETRGPISEQQLIGKLQSGEIAPATLLWTEELGDWKAAREIRALQPFLRA